MSASEPHQVLLHGAKAAGRIALVDAADADLAASVHWNVLEYANPSGSITGPYAMGEVRKAGRARMVYMHKLLTGYPLTDHVNHNTLDNQRSNLRRATHAGNSMNQVPRVGCSSAYKGVVWSRAKRKWVVRIRAEGVSHYLGEFADEIEAAQVYDAAALIHHGEYAFLNFAAVTEPTA